MHKITICIDDHDKLIEGRTMVNEFEKYNILRKVKLFDNAIGHLEPGEYKIKIHLELEKVGD